MNATAFAVYAACVDFELALARLTGLTYRDVNALLFFVAWPLVTVGLGVWWASERALLRRARSLRAALRYAPRR